MSPLIVNIIVDYRYKRVLLYTKMLKETETEKTIGFLVTFLSLVAFQLGGLLATPVITTYSFGVNWDCLVNVDPTKN